MKYLGFGLRLWCERGDLYRTRRFRVLDPELALSSADSALVAASLDAPPIRNWCNLHQFSLRHEPHPLRNMLGALGDGQFGAVQVLRNFPQPGVSGDRQIA
jgi:hypothetical protein